MKGDACDLREMMISDIWLSFLRTPVAIDFFFVRRWRLNLPINQHHHNGFCLRYLNACDIVFLSWGLSIVIQLSRGRRALVDPIKAIDSRVKIEEKISKEKTPILAWVSSWTIRLPRWEEKHSRRAILEQYVNCLTRDEGNHPAGDRVNPVGDHHFQVRTDLVVGSITVSQCASQIESQRHLSCSAKAVDQ